MRVVLDTNVLISRLLIATSVSAQAVDRALLEAEIVTSEAIMEELSDVLSRDKWDPYISVEDRQEFVRRFLRLARIVPVLSEIDECRDPSNNRFLELAFDAQASHIISGDKDLLELTPWREILIITPGDYLKLP